MLSLFLLAAPHTTINWQGYTWQVKNGPNMGPGPNSWSDRNVWVDANGYLHLKISQGKGAWQCAELWTTQSLGYGTYQCDVESRLDTLDANVIFSMFPYLGPDGTQEIDIEYARWGNPAWNNGSYTVYPQVAGGLKTTQAFMFHLDGSYTTSRLTWTSKGIHFWLMGGHQPINIVRNVIHEWNDTPVKLGNVPNMPMPLHFNLWLFQGKPPTDGRQVEVIVHRFQKTA